jgi:hypothetical protein
MFEQPLSPGGRGESGAIRLSFFARAGDAIAFDWNFISLLPDGDSAYFTLWSDSFRHSELLRDLQGPFGGIEDFQPSNVDLCSRQFNTNGCDLFKTKETGYVTKFVPIEEDGWYTLGFGLVEISEGTVPSALALDNIRLVSVPEPSTLPLRLWHCRTWRDAPAARCSLNAGCQAEKCPALQIWRGTGALPFRTYRPFPVYLESLWRFRPWSKFDE